MALTPLGYELARQKCPARWNPSANGPDSLTIEMDVLYSRLDTYRNTLVKWSACPLDNAMFLASFPNDDNRWYPTVSLNYIGFRRGQFPVPSADPDVALISATYQNSAGNFSLTIQALTPTVTVTHFSGSETPPAGTTPPGSIKCIFGRYHREEGYVGVVPASNEQALLWFTRLQITTSRTRVIVPGRYWQHEVTTFINLEGVTGPIPIG